MRERVPPLDRARAAWGDPPPDWVRALAEACAADSQNKVGQRIGYSAATVNQVLGGSYRGDLARVETAVRGALLAETVACPVLGEIDRQRCLTEQDTPFAPTSSLRARLYRACRDCPNRRSKQP